MVLGETPETPVGARRRRHRPCELLWEAPTTRRNCGGDWRQWRPLVSGSLNRGADSHIRTAARGRRAGMGIKQDAAKITVSELGRSDAACSIYHVTCKL